MDDVHFLQSLEANMDIDERRLLLQYKNRALEDLTHLLYQPSINFMTNKSIELFLDNGRQELIDDLDTQRGLGN